MAAVSGTCVQNNQHILKDEVHLKDQVMHNTVHGSVPLRGGLGNIGHPFMDRCSFKSRIQFISVISNYYRNPTDM